MSETQHSADDSTEITINDNTTLGLGDAVEHVEYGMMAVESLSSGWGEVSAELESPVREDGLSITLSEEQIREAWGETIHTDPEVIHSPKVQFGGVSLPESEHGVEVDITVTGDDQAVVEAVAMHARDEIVRAMQAMEYGVVPEETDGSGISVNWPKKLDLETDDE